VQQEVKATDLPVTENDLGLVESNFNPVLYAVTESRLSKKTTEAHAVIYLLGRHDVNANV